MASARSEVILVIYEIYDWDSFPWTPNKSFPLGFEGNAGTHIIWGVFKWKIQNLIIEVWARVY